MSKTEKKLTPKSNGQQIQNKEVANKDLQNEDNKKQHLSHWDKKESKWDAEHPLHFHIIPFIFDGLLFIVTSLIMFLGVKTLLSNTLENQIHPELVLIIGMFIILSFVIWISILTLCFRRVFRIDRDERIAKAIAKHEKMVERHFKHLNRQNRYKYESEIEQEDSKE